MSDWLTEGHLAWFVIDAVAVLDTSGLHERAAARRDGTPARSTAGRAGYDPDMLLALLIYGYACGERSSRRFERLCATDVAFRVICAGDVPDHTVISRFRQTHADSFVELFAQVLRLCRAAGLAQLGTVAIDGTKIAANASRLANRSHEWLAAEATRRDPARCSARRAETSCRRAGPAEADVRPGSGRRWTGSLLSRPLARSRNTPTPLPGLSETPTCWPPPKRRWPPSSPDARSSGRHGSGNGSRP